MTSTLLFLFTFSITTVLLFDHFGNNHMFVIIWLLRLLGGAAGSLLNALSQPILVISFCKFAWATSTGTWVILSLSQPATSVLSILFADYT